MKGWLTAMEKENQASGVKAVLRTAVLQVKDQYGKGNEWPIAIAMQGGATWVKATQQIRKGELAVPLFVRRDGSMILRDTESRVIHPLAVNAVVSWPTTEEEQLKGLEESHRDITISVQPEYKLPSAVAGKPSSWEIKDNGHPFWVIPRQKTEAETPNCEMADQTTQLVVCCQPKPPLDTTARAAALTYNVRLPYIVNTRPIEADEKVILEWALPKKRRD